MLLKIFLFFFALIHFSSASDFIYATSATASNTTATFDDFFDSFLFEEGIFEVTRTLSDPLEIWQEAQDFELMKSNSLSEKISSEGGPLPKAVDPSSDRTGTFSVRIKSHKSISAQLKQKFNSQYPSEKFDLRHYEVINWPEDVDLFKKFDWTDLDMEKIEANLEMIVFKKRERKQTRKIQSKLEEHAEAIDEDISYEEAHSVIKQRFIEETGYKSYIKWHLLDKSALPLQYADISFNHESFLLTGLHKNREILDNIHFKGSPPEIKEGGEIEPETEADVEIISQKKLKTKLKKAFKEQFPFSAFYLRDFHVKNWPVDVDIFKSQWTLSEIAKITAKIPQFVFIKRERPPNCARNMSNCVSEHGLDRFGNLSATLLRQWNEDGTSALLLERDQFGPAASSFDWIDKKYDPLPRIYYASSSLFTNPEIIDNIFPEQVSKKRQSEEIVGDEAIFASLKASRQNF